MAKKNKDTFGLLFRILPLLLGLTGLAMFIFTVVAEHEPPIQSLYWFLLVIAAFILPYIKEVTFGDIKVTLEEGLERQQKELAETKEELEKQIQQSVSFALDRVNKVDEEFGKIRDELIRGYQIYLMEVLKTDEERYEKVAMLNKMYWEELKLSISHLKTLLQQAGFYKGDIDDQYSRELIKAIQQFQSSLDMVPDGIFGHNSLKKLEKSLETTAE
jgi:murein L,D-transpeptidase YcbB/YkuD